MTTELITEPQGIVDGINNILIKKLESKKLLSKLQEELENTELYQRIISGQELIKNLSEKEEELKQKGKQILLESGIKKFEALDGTIVQLNKKPGALVIEDEKLLPNEYTKEKIVKSIDKTLLKKDIQQGLIIDGVYIKEDYNLFIKHT